MPGRGFHRQLLTKLTIALYRVAALPKRLRLPRRKRRGVIAVAAAPVFPDPYLTAVYREVTGMLELIGADVRILYWRDGDVRAMHEDYKPLLDCASKLPQNQDLYVADLQHFERTRRDRCKSLFEVLAEETGKSVAELRTEQLVLRAFTFARRVEDDGADYIHSYFFYSESFFALVAGWLLGIPRGITAYVDHMLDDYPFKLVDLHLETASLIVATSPRTRSELLEGYEPEDLEQLERIVILKPNTIDQDWFPFVKRGPPGEGKPFEIVAVSRIEEKKGLTILVDAVTELVRRGQRVIVHIVGTAKPGDAASTGYARSVNTRIKERGLDKIFVRHGFLRHEELRPIFERCKAFIAPYVDTERDEPDGIPTSVLEAMASGLPVVCTDAGLIRDIAEDGIEALFVPQRDVERLAEAIMRLITDPVLCKDLAAGGHQRIEQEFSYREVEPLLHYRIRALMGAPGRARGNVSG